ncbi:DUF2797 domain-containing protein [Aliikangiella marina]|uniref:DUF2797 domain-containing protein n=1 Tax=Aliikangiella marina TaxID=1712262 RepID=A0A545TCT8_9GAMM|nr:DUF2797 domain-containing protein [Aliikangiella marina]TQV75033.1 DUF2797 domain-containing protein [Aliikangiella marina]
MLSGHLSKMRADLGEQVEYRLPVGDEELPLNQFLGKTLSLEFTGNISCKHCGAKTNKSFSQGYCFPCMRSLAQCDMCIMKPETCHYHEGTCREPEWGEANCFVPHFVYLSNTSGLKVGITRHSQIPTRWIDQGATQATTIFKVNTRQQSGLVEVTFKDLIADKTNWRALLKGNAEPRDLVTEAQTLKAKLQEKLDSLVSEIGGDDIESLTSEQVEINYPVLEFPEKIKSHNFDKNPLVEGTLMGIKGQYLLFDTGVINIRKFTSYEVNVSG